MNRKHTYTGVGTAAIGGVVAALGAMLLAGFSSESDKPSATTTREPADQEHR
jgi:hypothetical protein